MLHSYGSIHIPICSFFYININWKVTHQREVFISGEENKGEVKDRYGLYLLKKSEAKMVEHQHDFIMNGELLFCYLYFSLHV